MLRCAELLVCIHSPQEGDSLAYCWTRTCTQEPDTWLPVFLFLFCFVMGSHCVSQAGLELLVSWDPPW
jgi:hypothetical protein